MSADQVREALRAASHALAVVSMAQQLGGEGPGASADEAEPVLLAMRSIEQCIWEAAPRSGQAAVTMKALARLAGYAYTAHFRDAVHRLIERGWMEIEARSRGVRRRDKMLPVLGVIAPAN